MTGAKRPPQAGQLAPDQRPPRKKQAQEALREAEERLRTVVAGAPVVLFATDHAGVFTLVEGKALDGLGIKPGEMVGRSISDVYRGRPDLLEHMQRGLAGEECTSTTELGGVVFQYRVSPFRGRGGEIAGIIGIATDITERKRAEEALRESNQKLNAVIEASPLAVTAIDLDGNVLMWNSAAERLFGWSNEEIAGAPYPLVPYERGDEFDRLRDSVFSGDGFTGFQSRRRGKDGEEIDVSISAYPLRDAGGAVIGGVAMLEDISERRRAEEALRESEERLRVVVENIDEVVYVATVGADPVAGTVQFVSGAVRNILGYQPDEFLRDPTLWFQIVHPDDAPRLLETTRKIYESGEPGTREYRLRRKDTTDYRWMEDHVIPQVDGAGNVIAIQGVARDITERRRAEEALRESEEKYRDLVENINEVIYALDANGLVTYVSPAVEQIGGYSASEVIGHSFAEFIHPDDLPSLLESFQRTVAGNPEPSEYRVLTKSGEVHWVRSSSRPVYDGDRITGLRAVLMDITERRKADETISYLAHHDALTGLPNRVLFMDRLDLALAQARRSGEMLAVMSLDMDRFKAVNDTAGHSGGDQVLRSVGEQLARLVREGDTAARVGGDEFALLLPAIPALEDATTIAERVLAELRGPRLVAGRELQLTTSIGIAIHPDDGQDAETMLRNADAAMYQAKEQGRNNYQLFAPSMNTCIAERLALESGLRRALDRREFVVHYQPKANIASGRIVGAEALVRWQHTERGLVLPGEFIPLAEQTGLIVPLGEWVLRTACAQNKAWQEAGFPPLRVSVNLSMRQFLQSDLVQMVARALHETGLAPRYLELEITESVASQQPDVAILVLRQLREMGVHISVDDFGTGYSSLNYLKRFPIHTLKIDRSFVNELTTDPNDVAIASAIITLAHSLNLDAIAEGVETEEQLAFLKQRQCDEFQGFLLAKAVPAEALERMLAQESPLAASLRAKDGH